MGLKIEALMTFRYTLCVNSQSFILVEEGYIYKIVLVSISNNIRFFMYMITLF